jgi:hypothetical protein
MRGDPCIRRLMLRSMVGYDPAMNWNAHAAFTITPGQDDDVSMITIPTDALDADVIRLRMCTSFSRVPPDAKRTDVRSTVVIDTATYHRGQVSSRLLIDTAFKFVIT